VSAPDIVVVTTSYPRAAGDGEGHFVAAEVRVLRERGRVTVVAPGVRRPSLHGETVRSLGGTAAFGFPGALTRLSSNPVLSLHAAAFVARAIGMLRSVAPDELHAHFLVPCAWPIAVHGLRRAPQRFDVIVHGSDARLLCKLPWLRSRVARALCASGASLRFVSQELAELVLGNLQAPERRVLDARSRVEPCALDVSGAQGRVRARASLELAPEQRVAVVVARLVASKRVDVALAACSAIAELVCVVVGDGPERSRLAAQYPRVRFVGHVSRPEALAYIVAADVLVSASPLEGAPSVVREARALGTPVASVPSGDLPRWAATDGGLHVATTASELALRAAIERALALDNPAR
jgi:glycosyltransferase involved in cell wall biosynthesis